MESIKQEAKRNAKLATNLDNFRSRYMDKSDDGELKVIFPAAEIYSFEKNFFVLLANSKKVTFKPEWNQRPDYLSKEYYGNVIFWPLLLFVNRINSIEDFTGLDEVLIPSFDLLLEIVKDKIPYDNITSLEEDFKLSEARYYKIYPLDERELATIESQEVLEFVDPEIVEEIDEEIEDNIIDGGVY